MKAKHPIDDVFDRVEDLDGDRALGRRGCHVGQRPLRQKPRAGPEDRLLGRCVEDHDAEGEPLEAEEIE